MESDSLPFQFWLFIGIPYYKSHFTGVRNSKRMCHVRCPVCQMTTHHVYQTKQFLDPDGSLPALELFGQSGQVLLVGSQW